MLSIRKMVSVCASISVVAMSAGVFMSAPKPAEAGAPPVSGIVTFQYSVEGARPANTGWIGIHYGDPTYARTGYDFIHRRYTSVTDGAFYLAYEDGMIKILGNNVGQGGVMELRSYYSRIPRINQGSYTRFGVNAWQGGAYAIYDQANNRYIRVRITNIQPYTFALPTPPIAPPQPIYPPVAPIYPPVPPVLPPEWSMRPSTPSISYPTHNQTLTDFPRKLYPSWFPSVGANRYVLQVQCDYCHSVNAWTGHAMEYTSYSNSYGPIILPGDNQYRVRVKAIGANGMESEWSPYVYFSYQTPPATPVRPTTPVVYSPVNNGTMTQYPRMVRPTWSSSGVNTYKVQIECDYCHSYTPWAGGPIGEYTVTNGATWYDGVVLPGDNQYRVRVKAVNDHGVESDWSAYSYFRFDTRAWM